MNSNLLTVNEYIRTIFQHVHLTDADLCEISGMFARHEYPKSTMLLCAGEIWNTGIYIHKGLVRIFYSDESGVEHNKIFYPEGFFLWPLVPVSRKYESFLNMMTLEDVTLSICKFDRLHSWLNSKGVWEKFALPYLELMVEHSFLREYEFLHNSAAIRYKNFCCGNPGLVDRIPDYHLASYLGITNVTLSRIKNS